MTRAAVEKRTSNKIITERKERHANTALVLDLEKCTGCNLCYTICPRYAIERGPIGASIRKKTKAPAIRINYYKCIFCGLCAYICPFGALELQINNKPAEKIKRGVSLPYLEGTDIYCKRTDSFATRFIEGNITINNDLCPGGCSTCIEVCPVQCLELPVAPKDKPWKKMPKVTVKKEKCLYCGACLFACPAPGAIEIERTDIKHSEKGSTSQLWKNIKEKLLKPIKARYWFKEIRIKTLGGNRKSAPKRKELKESE
jgi:4Fe-4S ferredoxin